VSIARTAAVLRALDGLRLEGQNYSAIPRGRVVTTCVGARALRARGNTRVPCSADRRTKQSRVVGRESCRTYLRTVFDRALAARLPIEKAAQQLGVDL